MFDHLSIAVTDLGRSAAFYDAALAPLGHVRLSENARSVCYGPRGFAGGEPPFAILCFGDPAVVPRHFHLAFAAASTELVHRSYEAALAAGGTDNGPPGTRASYAPTYYCAFVLDPDGYHLEVVHHLPAA